MGYLQAAVARLIVAVHAPAFAGYVALLPL